ncbi:MAG: serine--tRNA ligase, partial [Acidimicrobiia bacterium]
MIDPRLLRDDPESVRVALRRRGSEIDLDALIEKEAALRATRQSAEELRAAQKEAGRTIATLEGEEKQRAIDSVADLAEKVKATTAKADRLEEEFQTELLEVPNLVAEDAADGFTEEDAVEIKRVGDGA